MLSQKGNLVYKQNEKLDNEWKSKLKKIMKYVKFPAFVDFIPNGYKTKLINGTDLWGENIFNQGGFDLQLTPLQRIAVIHKFKDIIYAGMKSGYYLADFTRKNVMVEGSEAYLVDFQVIQTDINEDYIKLWQQMLDYLKIDYQFNGDVKELYETLNRLS